MHNKLIYLAFLIVTFFFLSKTNLTGQCTDFEPVAAIITQSCSSAGCHGGGAGGTFLSYAELINNNSNCGGLPYIVAGDASASFFYDKVNEDGSVACGSPMPFGPGLSAAQIATIEDWINDGALDIGDCPCPDPGNCDDGICINGVETWNEETCECEPGTPLSDPGCDDGICINGVETWNEETCECDPGMPLSDPGCDDGICINGAETWNEETCECDPGTPLSDPGCDDFDCSNGLEIWNEETCECEESPPPIPCVDDGDCTNGFEVWNTNDCECEIVAPIFGCTDPNSQNFEPLATCDDGTCEPLALDIGLFNGQSNEEGNLINWTLLDPNVTSLVALEKRAEGNSEFVEIFNSEISVNENNKAQFSFIDREVTSPITYYRLVEIHSNGFRELTSDIIAVISHAHSEVTLSIRPNPVIETIHITYNVNMLEPYSLQILDITGKLIVESIETSDTNYNTKQLSFGSYNAGVYMIKLTQGQNVELIKFVKM